MFAAVAVTVAVSHNPLAAVTRFLEEHHGTVRHYDFIAGTSGEVSAELIKATRLPWIGSRISADQEAWFIKRARSAPWHLVHLEALLHDADATKPGELYDAASVLWDHFWTERPKHVATAKISKVLYLMRPGLVPILDRRLRSFYDTAAKAAAREVASRRPEFAARKRMTWEAVRRDLLSNKAAILELRAALGDMDCVLAREVSAKLSDLRLLDILAWDASAG